MKSIRLPGLILTALTFIIAALATTTAQSTEIVPTPRPTQSAALDSKETTIRTFRANDPDIKDETPVIRDEAQSAPVVYIIEQQLPEVLRQAARRNGYEIKLTKRVRGVLKKTQLPIEINAMMEKIAPQFDLKWHYQNKQLFVSLGSESASRLIYLGKMDMEQLESAMKDAGIKGDKYELSYVEESNSVLVNGPVSYIANIELLAESYNKNIDSGNKRIKVIRYGNVDE
ncbi:MAG: hypothetical protein AAFW66_04155 [Pseudomonadota bacterium]